jgi:hypothetical protein
MLLNRLDTKVQLRSNHLVGESACHHSPALQSGVDGYRKDRKTQPHSKNALLRNLFAGLLNATGRIR